jgi:hypothetical protein
MTLHIPFDSVGHARTAVAQWIMASVNDKVEAAGGPQGYFVQPGEVWRDICEPQRSWELTCSTRVGESVQLRDLVRQSTVTCYLLT